MTERYELTVEDRYIVAETTKRVTAVERPRIAAIHEKMLVTDRRRLGDLERELRALDRAILMREAALDALSACPRCHGDPNFGERPATPTEVDEGCELGVAFDACSDPWHQEASR
ncbi:MAG: hypothetical protein V4472_25650 [Pseudomonadota bacterium]